MTNKGINTRNTRPCRICKGTGKIVDKDKEGISFTRDCNICKGKGRLPILMR